MWYFHIPNDAIILETFQEQRPLLALSFLVHLLDGATFKGIMYTQNYMIILFMAWKCNFVWFSQFHRTLFIIFESFPYTKWRYLARIGQYCQMDSCKEKPWPCVENIQSLSNCERPKRIFTRLRHKSKVRIKFLVFHVGSLMLSSLAFECPT